MSQTVRMSDIAKQMGISTVSVSKALSGKPGVSEELRSKVAAVAREMGYSRLRQTSGITGNIGVLVMDSHFTGNSFYAKLYSALVKKSADSGYTCVVEFLSEQMKEDAVMPTFLTRRNVDGIIFMGEISQPYVEAAAAEGLPCLTLDFYIPNLTMDYVVRDNIGGGLALTEYLLSQGCRSIGFVGDIHGSYNGLTRYLGYQWAMCRFGFDPRDSCRLERPEEIICGAGLPDGFPDAFVCATEKLAVDLTEILRKTGKQAVAVCFDDNPVPSPGKEEIAAYRVDAERMAEAAIRQMLCRIQGKDSDVLNCVVSGSLTR